MQRGQSVLNFNTSYSGPGDAYVPPDVEFAKELSKQRMFEEGEADLCSTSTADFTSLGYGIVMYFQFLKMLILCFMLAFLVTLPTLIFCVSGTALTDNFEAGVLGLTTIGNIGSGLDCAANSSSVSLLMSEATGDGYVSTDDLCADRVGFFFNIEMALSDVMFFVSSLDVVASLVVLLCAFQFHVRLSELKADVDRHHLTAADYAVEVRGLPRDATKAELLEHFSGLYDLSRSTSYTFRGWCGVFCRRRKQTSQGYADRRLHYQQVTNTALNTLEGSAARERYHGKWVAEVSLVLANCDVLRRFLRSEATLIKLQRFRAKVRKLREEAKTNSGLSAGMSRDL